MTILTNEMIVSSSPKMKNKLRCVTPESTVELNYDDLDDDDDDNSIPHLLNPNMYVSDQEDSDCEFERIETSTPYVCRRFECKNASTIASVSSLSQNGGISKTNFSASSSKIPGPSKSKTLSFRFADEYLEDPSESINPTSNRKMHLKPKKREDHKALSSSFLSPIQRSNRNLINSEEKPSPPSTSKRFSHKHRRSASQPGARNVRQERKLSTLKEGCESSDFDIPMMPIQYTPHVDPLERNMHSHKRTMSLPDQFFDAIGSQRPLNSLRVLHPYTALSPTHVNDPSMIRIGSKVYVSVDPVDAGSAITYDSYASDYSNSTGSQVQDRYKNRNRHMEDQVKATHSTAKGTSPSEEEIALSWKNMTHQNESGPNKETKYQKSRALIRRRGSPANAIVEVPHSMNLSSKSSEKYKNKKERNRESCVLQ